MPVIFVTVEEALGDLAQLKRGERVVTLVCPQMLGASEWLGVPQMVNKHSY
jgi:hypothetical protein